MAKHTYELVYVPKWFPDSYVLFTYEGDSYAVRLYSETGVRRFDSGKFGVPLGAFKKECVDRRPAEAHRTDDRLYWWTAIRRANRSLPAP